MARVSVRQGPRGVRFTMREWSWVRPARSAAKPGQLHNMCEQLGAHAKDIRECGVGDGLVNPVSSQVQ